MRGKRSKQYRKLIEQYARGFGFREPYQVILDAEMVSDAVRCKINLVPRLTQTLHGEVKPIITQCSIRHLYAASTSATTPANRAAAAPAIELAKEFERRRCGHHPDTHPEPLPDHECIASVVGPTNKHRYMVASQDASLRRDLRGVAGVPLVYVERSVMKLDSMADETVSALEKGERAKFRGGLKARAGDKRKRAESDLGDEGLGREGEAKASEEDDLSVEGEGVSQATEVKPLRNTASQETNKKKSGKKRYGKPKGPNPLSVRKSRKRPEPS